MGGSREMGVCRTGNSDSLSARQNQLIDLSPQKVMSGPVKAQSVSGSAVLGQTQPHCKCDFAQYVFALSADKDSGDG